MQILKCFNVYILKKTTVDINSEVLPGRNIPYWFVLAIPNLPQLRIWSCPCDFFVLAFGLKKKNCELFLELSKALYSITQKDFCLFVVFFFKAVTSVCW